MPDMTSAKTVLEEFEYMLSCVENITGKLSTNQKLTMQRCFFAGYTTCMRHVEEVSRPGADEQENLDLLNKRNTEAIQYFEDLQKETEECKKRTQFKKRTANRKS